MMLSVDLSLPLVASLCLILSNIAAAGHCGKVPNVYLPAPCPSNASETYLSITNAVIPASIDKVWAYTGDFFNITWQNITVTATTGIDNEPGASRTFYYGFDVVEHLLEYVDTPQVKYYEYGFSIDDSAPAVIDGILFTNLYNFMKATNITEGSNAGKTTFEYSQRGCANDGVKGPIFWSGIHNAFLVAIIAHFS